MPTTRLPILLIPFLVAQFLNGTPGASSYGATPIEVRAIALSGQAAAGTLGATFDTLLSDTIVVNDNGQVAFGATLKGAGVNDINRFGLWTGTGFGNLNLVARWDERPPGLPDGVTYGDYEFSSSRLNSQGEMVFLGGLLPAVQPIEAGVWSTAGGTRLLAAQRYPLPGAPGTPIVTRVGSPLQDINDAGQAAFSTLIGDTQTIWVDTPGHPLRSVISTGTPAPGAPGGTSKSFGELMIDANGRTAFYGQISSIFGSTNAIWTESQGAMQLLARQDDAAFGFPGWQYYDVGAPSLSSTGMVGFGASIYTGNGPIAGVVYAQRPDGSLRVAAQTQTPAPGTTGVFTNIYGPLINAAGHVAFDGYFSTYASFNPYPNGIWVEGSGNALHLVVQGGVAPPDMPGVLFDSFDRIQFNDQGQVLFEGFLRRSVGGVTEATDECLWIYNPDGSIRLIAREGDQMDVAAGPAVDMRRILYLDSISAYGGLDRYPRTLNNKGQVLFWAQFTDGSSGVFLTTVPEPATLWMLLAGILMVCSRRRTTVS